jgi:hypothetical protein
MYMQNLMVILLFRFSSTVSQEYRSFKALILTHWYRRRTLTGTMQDSGCKWQRRFAIPHTPLAKFGPNGVSGPPRDLYDVGGQNRKAHDFQRLILAQTRADGATEGLLLRAATRLLPRPPPPRRPRPPPPRSSTRRPQPPPPRSSTRRPQPPSPRSSTRRRRSLPSPCPPPRPWPLQHQQAHAAAGASPCSTVRNFSFTRGFCACLLRTNLLGMRCLKYLLVGASYSQFYLLPLV